MDTATQNFADRLKEAPSASTKESMNEAMTNFKKAAGNVKDAARSLQSETKEDLSAYMREGQEQIKQASSKAETFAREKPLLVVGGAFVAGWFVSRMFK
ncbi:hypothetical protein TDB9533_02529 [Thalassocella blandensis]|nr:hypothetical protein TDB9533_02529 [Thalassocella blandensis]